MQVGLMAPQGWKGEYDGWNPRDAWARTLELAAQAETLGFESLWVFDHFHTVPQPADEMTLESFAVLAALAMGTERVRLGHMVVCTGFRNPALTAKLSSTIDVISGGRFELGIGAGWKEDEWRAYGYGFPPLPERLAVLGDHLEVITEMFAAGPGDLRRALRACPRGDQRAARAPGAAHPDHRRGQRPEGDRRLCDPVRGRAQLRVPRVPTRPPTGCARCASVARPKAATRATLRFSMYVRDEHMRDAGQERIDLIGRFAEIGLDRLVAFPTRWSPTLEAQEAFAGDCEAAGIELEGRVRA